jgi:hypothetical protein
MKHVLLGALLVKGGSILIHRLKTYYWDLCGVSFSANIDIKVLKAKNHEVTFYKSIKDSCSDLV